MSASGESRKTVYSLAVGKDADNRLNFQDSLVGDKLAQAFRAADIIKKIQGLTVVDFGCGTSSTYAAYDPFCPGKYIGIDVESGLL